MKWALFISGQGSNMSALLDDEPDKVGLIVSSRPDAYGLLRARRKGLETVVLDKKIDWLELYTKLEQHHITHIFLTGFMKVVPGEFLRMWKKTILNVHPSLLPHYPGLKSIERAILEKSDLGITVHKVIDAVDAGETVIQKKVFSYDEYKNLSQEQIEFSLHLAEYELVRHSFKVASCWM